MSEPVPDLRPVPSESWTGEDFPASGRTRLDGWADAHPWAIVTLAISVLAAVSTARAASHQSMSWLNVAELFTLVLLALAAVFGSVIGGVLLFCKLTDRIKRARLDQLTTSQKRCLLVLLGVLFFLSIGIGPVAVLRLLALIGGQG